ncbi:MAG TPA: hypothetical protein VE196_03955 [Pseudonocardiaceae bacterium]|nr:hypothetical protein [Pseudonocardiaceae bacterium]
MSLSRVELFARIRRDRRTDPQVSVRTLADRYQVHRKTVREAPRGNPLKFTRPGAGPKLAERHLGTCPLRHTVMPCLGPKTSEQVGPKQSGIDNLMDQRVILTVAAEIHLVMTVNPETGSVTVTESLVVPDQFVELTPERHARFAQTPHGAAAAAAAITWAIGHNWPEPTLSADGTNF